MKKRRLVRRTQLEPKNSAYAMNSTSVPSAIRQEAPQRVYMDATTMKVIPTAHASTPRVKRGKYTPSPPTKPPRPPTKPTHVYVVSTPEARTDGNTALSPAYVVKVEHAIKQSHTRSQSSSTTPESPQSVPTVTNEPQPKYPDHDECRG
jgi:hypothetical protein